MTRTTQNTGTYQEREATIQQIAVKGKGILAADESIPTITKRLKTIKWILRQISIKEPCLGPFRAFSNIKKSKNTIFSHFPKVTPLKSDFFQKTMKF